MNIEQILKDNNVLKTGHFLLSSGLHSAKYFEKFRILENPLLVQMFGKMIAEYFKDKNISIVCGPTTGGVIIAYEVARQMGLKCIFAEQKPDTAGRVIRRGFVIPEGANILVVDDVLTTGGSIKDTMQALKQFPGQVKGIAVLIDRSIELTDFNQYVQDVDFNSCYRVAVENYEPDQCPLCRQNIPLEKPGRGGKK
ncbi:MAG: orotate phosphoribosyltransferase [Candidatus Latescibacteria bacterium]|nr:orotate phosphoribosyltransferase [Candidatus Latescibacterota bacterium]